MLQTLTTGRPKGDVPSNGGYYWETTQVKHGEPTQAVTFVHAFRGSGTHSVQTMATTRKALMTWSKRD